MAIWVCCSLQPLLLLTAGGLAALLYLLRPKPKLDVKGKVVWITGASSGIGEALADLLYSRGASVILSSRDKSKLDSVARRLEDAHGKSDDHSVRVLTIDLADLHSLPGKAKEALSLFGRIDVLINNAGLSTRAKAIDTKFDVDVMMMNVNFLSYVALTKAVLPGMIERRSGYIVNTSSMQGLVSIPFRASYAASKHALHGYFDCLRSEVASGNVLVLNVCPSYVRTNLSRNAVTADGSKHGKMDKTTEKGFPPEYVASQILQGMAADSGTLLVADTTSIIGYYMRTLCPSLLFTYLKRRAIKGEAEVSKKQ
eukprot:comp5044_c0_seq1/m.1143 comp5044_c0_seq1/g.1143  ORF comp5044_c0_seq1/g.1143 comp5044_c0_seq1/m.1143 type:complete len:312 (-) comp5044_c0_seq1:139-1074(-)